MFQTAVPVQYYPIITAGTVLGNREVTSCAHHCNDKNIFIVKYARVLQFSIQEAFKNSLRRNHGRCSSPRSKRPGSPPRNVSQLAAASRQPPQNQCDTWPRSCVQTPPPVQTVSLKQVSLRLSRACLGRREDGVPNERRWRQNRGVLRTWLRLHLLRRTLRPPSQPKKTPPTAVGLLPQLPSASSQARCMAREYCPSRCQCWLCRRGLHETMGAGRCAGAAADAPCSLPAGNASLF
jgi:hypothetical protein